MPNPFGSTSERERFERENPPDPNPPKNAAYWKRRAQDAAQDRDNALEVCRNLEARVAELEAENAELKARINPPRDTRPRCPVHTFVSTDECGCTP